MLVLFWPVLLFTGRKNSAQLSKKHEYIICKISVSGILIVKIFFIFPKFLFRYSYLQNMRETESRSINTQKKKNEANIQPS